MFTEDKYFETLNEGEIWIESKSNQGNIFAFSLPVLE
jgi:signal transduction histidine kinase